MLTFSEVSVRTQRYVQKADVAKLDDKTLKLIDVKRMQGKDKFFCEPDRERLREVSNV